MTVYKIKFYQYVETYEFIGVPTYHIEAFFNNNLFASSEIAIEYAKYMMSQDGDIQSFEIIEEPVLEKFSYDGNEN